MGLHRTSPQHHETGRITKSMLWIVAIALLLLGGYLELRTPQDDRATVTLLATAQAAAPVARTAPASNTPTPLPEVASPVSDEANAAHEALDPVGAGHGNAR